MKKLSVLAAFACAVLLCSACASKSNSYASTPQAAYDMAASEEAVYSAEPMAEYSYGNTADAPAAKAQAAPQAGDADVRKIVYTADMSVVADAPDEALAALTEQAKALGGYLSGSYTTTDEYGAYRCTATLKVPADRLEELVNAAKAAGKVESYQLSSDDISLSYYDIQARLTSAKAEEAQLTEILSKCETVEDVLLVRAQLSQVRSDIESYQAQINLWDHLVAYATLELTVRRTPRTAVEGEKELLTVWKASDVWQKMKWGFANTARWLVNALGAVGIFLAYAILPAAILLAIIFIWRKLNKKAAAGRDARRARRAEKRAEAQRKKEEKARLKLEEKARKKSGDQA